MFHEVKVNLVSAEAERICIDRMVKGQEDAFSTPEGLADVDGRMASLVRDPAVAAAVGSFLCVVSRLWPCGDGGLWSCLGRVGVGRLFVVAVVLELDIGALAGRLSLIHI